MPPSLHHALLALQHLVRRENLLDLQPPEPLEAIQVFGSVESRIGHRDTPDLFVRPFSSRTSRTPMDRIATRLPRDALNAVPPPWAPPVAAGADPGRQGRAGVGTAPARPRCVDRSRGLVSCGTPRRNSIGGARTGLEEQYRKAIDPDTARIGQAMKAAREEIEALAMGSGTAATAQGGGRAG